MTTQHTKGLWEAKPATESHKGWMVQALNAHYSNCNIAHYIGEANARLIAASPTLYQYAKRKAESGCNEACEMLVSLGIS